MDDFEDPTTQLNFQIAEMIADTFGRAVENFDIELADQIIAKVLAEHDQDKIVAVEYASTEGDLLLRGEVLARDKRRAHVKWEDGMMEWIDGDDPDMKWLTASQASKGAS